MVPGDRGVQSSCESGSAHYWTIGQVDNRLVMRVWGDGEARGEGGRESGWVRPGVIGGHAEAMEGEGPGVPGVPG